MTSYISTQSISSSMRQSILKMQAELAASQTELSTGTYADIGQTLGSRTGDSLSLQAQNSLLQTITDTNQTVATRLDTTQTILGSLQSNAQDLLNSLIESNGSNSNAGTIQASGESNLQSLISSLNSTLGGDYIFPGRIPATRPSPIITDRRRRTRRPLTALSPRRSACRRQVPGCRQSAPAACKRSWTRHSRLCSRAPTGPPDGRPHQAKH